MQLMKNLNPNRFSENNREYLQEYENANEVSDQKKIIKKIIENEKKCLQENEDLRRMQKVNNSKSTRELLLILLATGLAIAAGLFVFTFLVAASIISVPIFAALCFFSTALFTKGIGYSRVELNEQSKKCVEKEQLITELKAAELETLNVSDSEETMEKSSSAEKLDENKKSNVCFFQPDRANEENTDTNNLTSVNVPGLK